MEVVGQVNKMGRSNWARKHQSGRVRWVENSNRLGTLIQVDPSRSFPQECPVEPKESIQSSSLCFPFKVLLKMHASLSNRSDIRFFGGRTGQRGRWCLFVFSGVANRRMVWWFEETDHGVTHLRHMSGRDVRTGPEFPV